VSSDYIISDADSVVAGTGTFTATLPTASGQEGSSFVVKNIGTGTIIVGTTGIETIDGYDSLGLTPYDSATLLSNNGNWVII